MALYQKRQTQRLENIYSFQINSFTKVCKHKKSDIQYQNFPSSDEKYNRGFCGVSESLCRGTLIFKKGFTEPLQHPNWKLLSFLMVINYHKKLVILNLCHALYEGMHELFQSCPHNWTTTSTCIIGAVNVFSFSQKLFSRSEL